MQAMRRLSLLAFPGPCIPDVISGLTPPRDDVGTLVDMGTPGEWLHLLAPRLDGALWQANWIRQVHGRAVLAVDDTAPSGPIGTADAMVTRRPGVLLVTRHADCAPILFWDPRVRALGLAHSGRRGTLANIAAAVIDVMGERYGTAPHDLQISIGAGIRACCYEIQEDVASEIQEANGGQYLVYRQGATYFDGPRMISDQCRDAGAVQVHGGIDGECTCCGPNQYFSYRRDGSKRRFAAVAGMA